MALCTILTLMMVASPRVWGHPSRDPSPTGAPALSHQPQEGHREKSPLGAEAERPVHWTHSPLEPRTGSLRPELSTWTGGSQKQAWPNGHTQLERTILWLGP